MNLTINTNFYDKNRGNFTYVQIQELIENKYNVKMSLSQISKCFTGKSTSYKSHFLICDILDINFKEVYNFKKGDN